MKKILKTMSALMCGLVMTTGFTACSDDNDDENKPKEEQQQLVDDQSTQGTGNIVEGTMAYSAMCADLEALKEIASDGKVYVKYFDANGAVQTEEFTGSFSKTINLKFNKNNELLAGLMLYINDVDWEKAETIVGRKELRANVTSKCTFNYEKYKGYVKELFPTSSLGSTIVEESKYQEAMVIFKHNAENIKKEYGVIAFSAFGLSAKGKEIIEDSNIWKVTESVE